MEIDSFNIINSDYMNDYAKNLSLVKDTDDSFSSVLSAVMESLEETNELQNAAESAEIQFALGESENTHDLLIAAGKASVAINYTVAVRDKILEAYNTIMQMQI